MGRQFNQGDMTVCEGHDEWKGLKCGIPELQTLAERVGLGGSEPVHGTKLPTPLIRQYNDAILIGDECVNRTPTPLIFDSFELNLCDHNASCRGFRDDLSNVEACLLAHRSECKGVATAI